MIRFAGYEIFHDCCFGFTNIVGLVFLVRTLTIVRRSPDKAWHAHTRWLTILVIDAVGIVIGRTIRNMQSLFGVRLGDNLLLFDSLLYVSSSFVGVYGVFVLFQTFRRLVPAPSLAHRTIEQWPDGTDTRVLLDKAAETPPAQNPWVPR